MPQRYDRIQLRGNRGSNIVTVTVNIVTIRTSICATSCEKTEMTILPMSYFEFDKVRFFFSVKPQFDPVS